MLDERTDYNSAKLLYSLDRTDELLTSRKKPVFVFKVSHCTSVKIKPYLEVFARLLCAFFTRLDAKAGADAKRP